MEAWFGRVLVKAGSKRVTSSADMADSSLLLPVNPLVRRFLRCYASLRRASTAERAGRWAASAFLRPVISKVSGSTGSALATSLVGKGQA